MYCHGFARIELPEGEYNEKKKKTQGCQEEIKDESQGESMF